MLGTLVSDGWADTGKLPPSDFLTMKEEMQLELMHAVSRGKQPDDTKKQVWSGTHTCNVVWQNGVAYCEFSGPETPSFRVKASTVLEAVQRMALAHTDNRG